MKLGKLYIDITDNLISAVEQNKNHNSKIKYENCLLVYYESAGDVLNAIKYKKKLEKWDTFWKYSLIESINPDWLDLYDDLIIHKNSDQFHLKRKYLKNC